MKREKRVWEKERMDNGLTLTVNETFEIALHWSKKQRRPLARLKRLTSNPGTGFQSESLSPLLPGHARPCPFKTRNHDRRVKLLSFCVSHARLTSNFAKRFGQTEVSFSHVYLCNSDYCRVKLVVQHLLDKKVEFLDWESFIEELFLVPHVTLLLWK